MTVALVTGGHGWVGRHLRSLLTRRGYVVFSLGRQAEVPGDVDENYIQADLAHSSDLANRIEAVRADVVFHLAAVPPQASTIPAADAADGVLGTYQLCRALLSLGRPIRLVVAGSSAEYGPVARGTRPIPETWPCRPVSEYGFSKFASELIALGLGSNSKLDVVAARPFNHTGPGEPSRTVCGTLARAVARVACGEANDVPVSDLDVVRDFTDIRDVALAYLALADRGVKGRAYNVCSGRPTTIREVLDRLLMMARLPWSCVSEVPSGSPVVPFQLGSPARIRRDTGWRAVLSLEESLSDLLLPLLDRR